MVSFSETEEQIFQQTVEWLSERLSNVPIFALEKSHCGFFLNPYTRVCTLENGNTIFLTAKEFDLLYLLFSHKGHVFTKKQIYENVWNEIPEDIDNAVMCLIYSLRRKLEDKSAYRYIQTVRGVGYKFERISVE